MTQVTRPALRYHGGKYRLAPWIVGHFPEHRVYTEVFGGACSVLMRKPRADAEMVNDLNGEVVNFFRVLRDPEAAGSLVQQLLLTPYARTEFEMAFAPVKDPVEMARRTVIRSFMGFGSDTLLSQTWRSGFRSDTRRRGGIPARDWAHYPGAIGGFTERLQGVVIENRPAIQLLQEHDRRDALHYIDPPYLHSTRGASSGKPKHPYPFEMSDADHEELASVLHSLAGMVVLSGHPSPLYDRLFGGWERHTRRHTGDGAAVRTECLWLNAAATARQQPALELEATS